MQPYHGDNVAQRKYDLKVMTELRKSIGFRRRASSLSETKGNAQARKLKSCSRIISQRKLEECLARAAHWMASNRTLNEIKTHLHRGIAVPESGSPQI